MKVSNELHEHCSNKHSGSAGEKSATNSRASWDQHADALHKESSIWEWEFDHSSVLSKPLKPYGHPPGVEGLSASTFTPARSFNPGHTYQG